MLVEMKSTNLERSLSNEEGSSLRQILSSHSSIYNALNNPDLDASTMKAQAETPTQERFSTEDRTLHKNSAGRFVNVESARFSPDLDSSISAWQAIGGSDLNSIHRPSSPFIQSRPNSRSQLRQFSKNPPQTSSILSITTDEEPDVSRDSTVIVPSKIMLFETDEEDAGEYDERSGKRSPSISFVMPVMSVSDNIPSLNNFNLKPFQITVLSSQSSYQFETNQLIKDIETDLDYINISHFNASDRAKSTGFDSSVVKNSDLVFIVNDGSRALVEYLSHIFNGCQPVEEQVPKLTIINMMTVNYFINLFDLINNLKPYQIWKTSSLKQEKLVNKLKTFIELEVNQSDQSECSSQLSKKDKNLSLTLAARSKSFKATRSRTMYSSLISTKKPNYKSIEKHFKSDLHASSSFEDPLRISQRFHHLNILYSVAKKMLSSIKLTGKEFLLIETQDKTDTRFSSNFWLVCSFTVGIGIGILASSGTKSILPMLYVQDWDPSPLKDAKVDAQADPIAFTDSTIKYISDCIDSIWNWSFIKEHEFLLRSFAKKLTYTSSLAMDGLEKVTGLVLYGHF